MDLFIYCTGIYIPVIMSQSLENLMGKIPSQMTGLFISVVKIIMVLIPMLRVTASLLLSCCDHHPSSTGATGQV